nr:transcription factor myb52 [Quercus suber]
MSSQQPHPQNQKPLNSGTWLPAEDHRLSEAVAQYGCRWVLVASKVETRNGDQCAKRWNEHLNPELDRSPWTAEEAIVPISSDEERLLNLVEQYGNNWKPIASSFFESRAPLALKNKYSLLMRRLKRRGLDQQPPTQRPQQDVAARHAARPRLSSSVTSPSIAGAVEQLNFYAGSGPVDLSANETAGINTNLPTTSLVANNDYIGNGMEFGSVVSTFETHSDQGGFDKSALLSDNGRDNHDLFRTQSTAKQQSAAVSDDGDSHNFLTSEVEYSVTCQRGRLKTHLNHLVEAALSESAPGATETDNVTVVLRLRH